MFLYSFTQIDLGLTLSKASIWQSAEKLFKNIGYFNRPLSASIFIVTIILLFAFYLLILSVVRKKEISQKSIWKLIIAITVILTFSYNAFSYDLFNYIFDAKVITFYKENPYFHKALDFPSDHMLSFMHWTHRLYPYGPVWLGLTVSLSFFGMQIFLPTFFLFKILVSATFLGTIFYIGKILQKISPENKLFGIVFFALNPLVVVESLVSAHNDIVMMFFAVWSIYSFMNIKYGRSIILLILSIGIKFATILLVPVFVLLSYLEMYKKSINWEKIILLMTGLMIIAVFTATFRTTFQPWYLIYPLTFSSLLPSKYFVAIPAVVISFFAVFQYLPFIYLGNWDNPIPSVLNWAMISSIILPLVLILAWKFKKSDKIKL